MLVRPERTEEFVLTLPEELEAETRLLQEQAEGLGYSYDVNGYLSKQLRNQNRRMTNEIQSLQEAAKASSQGSEESESDGEDAVGD